MTYSTPLYGIPVPDGTSLAKNLPAELKAMGEGFEAALNAHVAIPVSNAAVVTATSAAARDSYWGTPTTETARLTLQARGATTIRTDKNITERFFATYDSTSNPQGMTPAGWYPIGSPSSLIPTTRSAAERDAIFGTPSTSATQIELQNRGARTYRADLGVTEQYFAAYNATSNLVGRDSPGWYSTTRQTGLVPIKPSSIVVAGGTASVNALGKVTFTNATSIKLIGTFGQLFDKYLMVYRAVKNSTNANDFLLARFATAGVSNTASYDTGCLQFSTSDSAIQQLGGYNAPYIELNRMYYSGGNVFGSIVMSNPSNAAYTQWHGDGFGNSAAIPVGVLNAGEHRVATPFDGIELFPSNYSMNGEVTIYGLNS